MVRYNLILHFHWYASCTSSSFNCWLHVNIEHVIIQAIHIIHKYSRQLHYSYTRWQHGSSSSAGLSDCGWINVTINVLTHQRQASQLSLYSLWEWSTCMFPYQTAWLWTVSVKCLRASVCWWTAMFFQSRTDADHLEVLDQNATDGQIWVSDQVASTPQLWKQHLWQVPDDMAEWCHHQRMPILAEVDQLPEGDLGRNVVFFILAVKMNLPFFRLSV